MHVLLIGVSKKNEKKITTVLKTSSIKKLKGPCNNSLNKELLSRFSPEDIVLIFLDDSSLPGNADVTCRQIKELDKILNVSIILIIDKKPNSTISKVIQAREVEFITKPLQELELETRVRSCLSLQREKTRFEEAQKWFIQVTEHMPVIFADYEDGFKVRYGNSLGSEIWGVPHEDIIGSSDEWIRYIHRDDRDRVVESIKNLDKEPLLIQYRIIRPDGQMRWIDDSFIPVFDENGKRIKVFGFGQDITKRKLAEHSLQRSEEHLSSLMETATNFAVYRLAFEDDDPLHSEAIFVSPSIMDILGVTEPGFATWLDIMHPDDSKRIRENLNLKPIPPKFETTVRVFHPEHQQWRWIRFIANRLFDEKGQLIYSNGIIFDVTTQVNTTNTLKEKEEELTIQAKKQQRLNNALSVLLEHQEKKSEEIRSNILETLEKFVLPYLHDLTLTNLNRDQQAFLEIIKSHLKNISSSFAKSLSTWKSRLSPAEIKVADFVRSGKTTKEISKLLNVSNATISFHRANIRVKLEIKNEKINLISHLQTIEQD